MRTRLGYFSCCQQENYASSHDSEDTVSEHSKDDESSKGASDDACSLRHTVCFKCIGVTLEREYQDVLRGVSNLPNVKAVPVALCITLLNSTMFANIATRISRDIPLIFVIGLYSYIDNHNKMFVQNIR